MTQSGWHGSPAVYRVDRSLRIFSDSHAPFMGFSSGSVLSVHLEKWMFPSIFILQGGARLGFGFGLLHRFGNSVENGHSQLVYDHAQTHSEAVRKAYRRDFRPPSMSLEMVIPRITLVGKPTMPQEARYQTWTPA